MNTRILIVSLGLLAAYQNDEAHAQIAVLGNSVQEHEGTPGALLSGTIAVSNASDRPQVARLYLTDYQYSADGTSRFDAPGSTTRSSASWVQLSASEVLVPAGATIPVAYTIRVPAGDSISGSYWNVIMVETKGPAKTGASATGVGLSASIRYGIQVVTSIVGSDDRRLTIRSGTLAADSTGSALALVIENAGTLATRFAVTTEIYDAGGAIVGRFEQQRGLTYPGSTLAHQVKLPQLAAGKYKAVVMIDAGNGSLSGAQYTLRF